MRRSHWEATGFINRPRIEQSQNRRGVVEDCRILGQPGSRSMSLCLAKLNLYTGVIGLSKNLTGTSTNLLRRYSATPFPNISIRVLLAPPPPRKSRRRK